MMKEKKYRIFSLVLLVMVSLISACVTAETERDPSKKGYLLAEKLIQEGRYHDGLLMHRVNARFFPEFAYAQNSARRIQELNDLLKKSVQGRPELEMIKQQMDVSSSGAKVLVTIVNNSEKKIRSFDLSIQVFDAKGALLRNRVTGRYSLEEQNSKELGAWDIAVFSYDLSGFTGVSNSATAKVLFRNILYDQRLSFEPTKPADKK